MGDESRRLGRQLIAPLLAAAVTVAAARPHVGAGGAAGAPSGTVDSLEPGVIQVQGRARTFS